MQSPTYIAVTFWGETYRRYFLDYCLASLMAPGNIPSIRDKNTARLLIATRDDDWEALQSEPIFIAARAHIGVEHVLHQTPLNVSHDNKMSVMSKGHQLLTRRMFEDRARGTIVSPDMVFADGAIRRIEQLGSAGYKVVLCIAVRFASDGLIAELQQSGLVTRGEPIVLDTKELVRLTITHMHSETVRLEFDADYRDRGACSFYWVVRPGQDLLFYSGNWAPLLIDYSSLDTHDESTFEKWTLDGDYVAKNFLDTSKIYVVRNTTELFATSFTPESVVSYNLDHYLPYRSSFLRRILKIAQARIFISDVLDDVKKEFLRIPIRVEGGVSPEKAWVRAEKTGAEVVVELLDNKDSLLVVFGRWVWRIQKHFITQWILIFLRPSQWPRIWRSARRRISRRLQFTVW